LVKSISFHKVVGGSLRHNEPGPFRSFTYSIHGIVHSAKNAIAASRSEVAMGYAAANLRSEQVTSCIVVEYE